MNTAPPLGLLGRLFLTPADARVYAAVRITFAVMALYNLMLLWPLRATLFADGGSIGQQAALERSKMDTLLLFDFVHTPGGVTLLMCGVAVAMLMLMAGVLPRLAVLIVFFWHLSIIERAPLTVTGWDMVLRAFGFLVLVSPLGSRWSLFRGQKTVPATAPCYGLMLMRLQLVVLYFQTVVSKLTNVNPFWRNGEFLPYFLTSHYARWPGTWPAENTALLVPLTYLTLVVEIAIPVLLLIPRTRHWGALLGLLFHASICVFSPHIGPFVLTMFMTYLAFMNATDMDKVENLARKLFHPSRGRKA